MPNNDPFARGRALAKKDERTKAAEEEARRKWGMEIDRVTENVCRVRGLLEPYFDSSDFDIEEASTGFTIKINCAPRSDFLRVWTNELTAPSTGLNLEICPSAYPIVEPVCEYGLTDERILELAGMFFEVVTEYLNDRTEREKNTQRAKQHYAGIAASNEETAQFRKKIPWIAGGIVVGLLMLYFG